MKRNPMYLWAIVPPAELAGQIDSIRKEFAASFNCVRGLKPPVHATLVAPFSSADEAMDEHMPILRRLIHAQPAFTTELKNFSFFENRKNRVVFIDVVPNPDLKNLNAVISDATKALFGFEEKGNPRFHPHFTIGYRDVSPQIFPEVKEAYRNRPFSASFLTHQVTLFRHNGSNWQVHDELPLHPDVSTQDKR